MKRGDLNRMGHEVLLRCYAERIELCWQAFCIDLCLAVQGESLDEVQKKLHEQVQDYLLDIFEGDDQPFAEQLLRRKAPRSQMAKYHHMVRRGTTWHIPYVCRES